MHGNELFLGGNFNFKYQNTSFNNFARLQTKNTTELGTWLSVVPTCNLDFEECGPQTILTIAINPNVNMNNNTAASVYIGGMISTIQGNVMNGLASLVGSSWVAFGSGCEGPNSFVFTLSLTSDYSYLYVGGHFSSANSVPVNDIVSWSLLDSQFYALSPVEGWEGAVFDILPISYVQQTTSTYDSQPLASVNPVSIGLIVGLTFIIFCLLFVIMVIVVAVIKFRPKDPKRFPNPEDSSLTQSEKESWDGKKISRFFFFEFYIYIFYLDFYSYEWEVSYNLLEISEAVGRGRNGIVHAATYKGQNVAVKICEFILHFFL